MKDIPLFLLKEKESPLLQFKFLDLHIQMNYKKLKEPIMKETLEKIPNGLKMDQENPLPLMLSILDFLDTIFIILKPRVIWLF